MEIVEIFRNALKRAMEGQPHGTQAKVARHADIDPRYLNDFLAGRRTMGEDVRAKIAQYFGYSYGEFLTIAEGQADRVADFRPIYSTNPKTAKVIEMLRQFELKGDQKAIDEIFDLLAERIEKEEILKRLAELEKRLESAG